MSTARLVLTSQTEVIVTALTHVSLAVRQLLALETVAITNTNAL